MFLSRTGWTRLLLILALVWYRSGRLVKNCILTRSEFPRGYVAGGNYATDCATARNPADAHGESLSACEDETFWELHDALGRVVERPVIATCDPHRRTWNTVMGPLRDPNPLGGLWLYAHGAPTTTGGGRTAVPRILAPDVAPNRAHRIALVGYPEGHDFHPLGAAVWPSYEGNASALYVVNHARARTVVEQFTISPARPLEAHHVRTISSRFFVSPNALALTSPDAFYVTNDHLITRRWPIIGHFLPIIETLLALPLGFVSHVTLAPPGAPRDIARHTFAKLFLPLPNGIAVNALGNRLAVSSSSLGQVNIYARNPATDSLPQLLNTVPLPFVPDNLHYSRARSTGIENIIVTGHPNFPDLGALAANKTGAAAPSWVVAIVPKIEDGSKPDVVFDSDAPVSASSKLPSDGARWSLQTLFQSDGVESAGGFGSSSTGLYDPDTGNLYVTGLYAEGGMMVCKSNEQK